jgi:hypothetical protein
MTTPVLLRSALWLVLGFAPAGICAAQNLTAASSFESFDTNRDGVVSKYEYDSDAVFASMDADHNNRVSAAELEALLGEAAGSLSADDRIRRADMNDDGELSDEELRRTAEMRFEWLDRNRDDNLDLAEMQSGFGIPAPPKPWRP